MLIAALVIGAITAYYFGLRAGGVSAVVAGALFLFGLVMPSKIIWTYTLVGAYTVGVLVIGPRLPGQNRNKQDFLGLARRTSSSAFRLLRKIRR